LKADGWTYRIVEHWNAFAKIRQDLWGFDILAIKSGCRPRAIQTTVQTGIGSRFDKLVALPTTLILSETHDLFIEGWRVLKRPRLHAECDRRQLVYPSTGGCLLLPVGGQCRDRQPQVADPARGVPPQF
jgi:hypothetical protein